MQVALETSALFQRSRRTARSSACKAFAAHHVHRRSGSASDFEFGSACQSSPSRRIEHRAASSTGVACRTARVLAFQRRPPALSAARAIVASGTSASGQVDRAGKRARLRSRGVIESLSARAHGDGLRAHSLRVSAVTGPVPRVIALIATAPAPRQDAAHRARARRAARTVSAQSQAVDMRPPAGEERASGRERCVDVPCPTIGRSGSAVRQTAGP